MATANHHLQQQRPIVEARIRTLVNNDLKEICRAHNYQVSGNKAHLQARCIEILRKIINDNNQTAFDALSYQISHHGQEPPPSFSHVKTADTGFSSPTTASYSHTHHSRPLPAQGRSALGRLPPPGRLFKPSPFYEIIDNVLPFDYLPEYPQNRNTVNATLRLKEDAVRRLAGDSTLRLLLYCGIDTNLAPNSPPIDISFPSQIEVKINGDDVRSNFKGLKNKPGSTKPADVTDKVRRNTGYGNMIAITYALTTKQYIFGIQLARYCNATTLTERIKQGRFIPKQTVLDEMSKANSDPDIATTSVRMSLKDPISTLRITVPIRSDRCAHNQCFDGSMFMQLQEQAPQWLCPICNRTILFESLRVDKYFEDILNRTPKSTEKVDIEPNGEWHVIDTGDNARDNPPRGPRAAYDDDFDDEDDDVEIVEIKDEPPSATLSNGSFARSMALPAISQMTTPPVSSREASIAQQNTQGTKRPATVMPTVIDLISSDEDEPVRPAKRRLTSTQFRNPALSTTNVAENITDNTPLTSSHNTPTSVPVAPHSVNRHQPSSHPAVSTSAPAANPSEPLADPFRQSTQSTRHPSTTEALSTTFPKPVNDHFESHRSGNGESNVGSAQAYFARYAKNSDPFGTSISRSSSPNVQQDFSRGAADGHFGSYREPSRPSNPPGDRMEIAQNTPAWSRSSMPWDADRQDYNDSRRGQPLPPTTTQQDRNHHSEHYSHRSPQGSARSTLHGTSYPHRSPREDAHAQLHNRPTSASSTGFGPATNLPPPPLSAPPSHRDSSSYQPPPQTMNRPHGNVGPISPDRSLADVRVSLRHASVSGNPAQSGSPPRSSGVDSQEDWWRRNDNVRARRDPWERGHSTIPDRRDHNDTLHDLQARPSRQSSFHHHNGDMARNSADSPPSARHVHDREYSKHPHPSWSHDSSTNYNPGNGFHPAPTNTNTNSSGHSNGGNRDPYQTQRNTPTTSNNSRAHLSTSPKTHSFPPPSTLPAFVSNRHPPSPSNNNLPPYPLDDGVSQPPPPSSQNWR